MNLKTALSSLAAFTAVGGLVLTPAIANADGDKGQKKGHNKSSRNSAPPKKNGRHDNRDWNKDKNSSSDSWYRNSPRRDQDNNDDWRRRQDDDWRRRQEEQRRQDDWRRREEERRRQEAWQREQDQRRWDDSRNRGGSSWESDRRQQTKNEWRNLAIAGGIVSLIGILEKDNRLTFAGAAGALYSLHRYEQDRKSQNRVDRARAYYFSQPNFYRNGQRYDRRMVTQSGQRYYQFCRA